MTFNDVSVMCNNSTDCDDGQFCHIPDGESEGECHTQVTLTAYIQESINNLTTTTPKPKPKGVNSILFPSIWLIKCEKLFDYKIHVNAYFPILGCGDYPRYIVSADYEDYEVLGRVTLGNDETYLSCRELCREAYPNFDFYHKFINYQSCDCARMVSEKPIKIMNHDAYTFGYADECKCKYLSR